MNICITASGQDLDASVDQTFGRARYFLFVDSETRETQVVENAPGAHGAGVQAAQLLSEKGASVLITGNVGPNAYQGLKAAGIKIYTGATGTSKKALEDYEAGLLSQTDVPTRSGHGGRR
ncbi:NifB/NifX family molybdenum-iron cluster-binding protein [Candidatus Bipolaricaulota bacterium]